MNPQDPNSFSRPDEIAVTHLHISLKLDFDKERLSGHVELTAERKLRGVRQLVLDTSDLTIFRVTDDKGKELCYKLHPSVSKFGSKLTVVLPEVGEEKFLIHISYETSPKASALQWLLPEQTAGKKHPYLFSQCQAIHCRSIIPCQDTPSAKTTYSAEITAPASLTVLMSAVGDGCPVQTDVGWQQHKFTQRVPIPTYLIALAVGDLESRRIGPRSCVWAEKEYVDKAAHEFSETESMLSIAEKLCGPYVWGVYDLLVLPPSFPYGGMENPCLTFVTPTLLAGDKSLADIVVHEISHSWTGNLVTNKNFEHFWLNEGFTMFVERKILGEMYGKESRLFSASRGLRDLNDSINTLGAENPLTQLVVDLRDASPDDSFSVVPYEKGHTFLFYLEQLAGGPDKFDPFLRAYLERFKYKSLDTTDFKNFLYEYFPDNGELLNVDWERWLFTPGMPPVIPDYATDLETDCEELKEKWTCWQGETPSPFKKEDLVRLSSTQVIEFLNRLLLGEPVPVFKLTEMEKLYGFNSIQNSEIHFRWLRLCIKGRWLEQIPLALKFVTEQGRMKFVRPIYRDLYGWEEARPKILERYYETKDNMMYVSAYTLAKDLQIG